MNCYKSNEIYYAEIFDIPVEMIYPNPDGVRKYFDNLKMNELIRTIQMYGIIQPLTVAECEYGYRLISGERRLRAAIAAGHETVPAIVVEADEEKSAVMTLLENLQREDLSFFEIAEGYKNLLSKQGITQEELARRIGHSQSSIANKIRLLRLSPRVRKLVRDYSLTERHARALLSIPDEAMQIEILKRIHREGLNVSQTERLIEDTLLKHPDKLKHVIKTVGKSDLNVFANTVNRAVEIMKNNGVDANMVSETHEWGSRFVIDLRKDRSE